MKLELIKKLQPEGTEKGNILFIHGACMAAWVWEKNFMPYFFDQGYNVYAVSLRNHGASEKNDQLRWTSVLDYVKDIEQVIHEIGKPVFLVGHSMGGFISQHYIHQTTANIKGVVLLCSAPSHGSWSLAGRLLQKAPLQFMISTFGFSWLPIMKNRKLLKSVMFSPDFPDERMLSIASQLQEESFLVFLEMLFWRLPKVKKAAVPVMIVGAENDFLVAMRDTIKMASAYGVEPLIIEDASHCFMLEPGWENTADKISYFLSLH